jgi:hypothetical protein
MTQTEASDNLHAALRAGSVIDGIGASTERRFADLTARMPAA